MTEKEKLKRRVKELEAQVENLEEKRDNRDWRQKEKDAKDCEAMRENIARCRDVHWGLDF